MSIETPEAPAAVEQPRGPKPAAASATPRVKRQRTGPRSRWLGPLVAVAVLAITAGSGITQTPPADFDRDGLLDEVEQAGWFTQDGAEYRTDPQLADSDGDGLTDADEAGSLITDVTTQYIYVGTTDPLAADTDGDGLDDGDEADLGLNPFDRDSDDDELADGPEIDLGTDPGTADTDGDGFADGYEHANRESQGLDPLWVDVEVSKTAYVTDFAKGAVLGDLNREDSLAWLAGNLTSGGSGFIPVVGWIVGGAADLRDVLGSAIHGDVVGSSFSAAGVVPYAGDAVAIPGKAAAFVLRNPEQAAAVAALIVALKKVPDAIKVEAARKIWKNWDDLKAAGVSDKALLQLQKGKTNLDRVAAAMARPGHVSGETTPFFAKWQDGEAWLAKKYGATTKGVDKGVRISTKGCGNTCSNSDVRIVDAFVDGVAHESKVGHVTLSAFTERQIRKDAWLIKNGDIQGAHWHFLPSGISNTVGVDPKVLDLLDELQIPYTIHLPA